MWWKPGAPSFLREMAIAAPAHGIELPDLELACAPIRSELGERYLGAMRAGINCALANRQILTHLTRPVPCAAVPWRATTRRRAPHPI
jgi:tRNA-splicing ligase RtcB (3'-phosphate/5'-hydroxy nucleic acid ligase)